MEINASSTTMRAVRKRSPWWTFGLFPSHQVTLSAEGGNAAVSFDLRNVQMTDEQRRAVRKLFDQSPIAVVSDGEHSAEAERGKDGPGLRYLTPAEFESIRRLGVRLGTKGELLAAQCDFCLHCVKLEALPTGGLPRPV